MKKPKKQKFPYKHLRPDQLEELLAMSTEDLYREHIKELRHVRGAKKQQKEDAEIIRLNESIKKHREEHEDMATVLEKKEEIKELNKTIDIDIQDDLQDRKDLKAGWRNIVNAHQEKATAIVQILEKRTKK